MTVVNERLRVRVDRPVRTAPIRLMAAMAVGLKPTGTSISLADQSLDSGFGEGPPLPAPSVPRLQGRKPVCRPARRNEPGAQASPSPENPQGGQVNSDAVITHNPDVLGERDPGLVDGEAVPTRGWRLGPDRAKALVRADRPRFWAWVRPRPD